MIIKKIIGFLIQRWKILVSALGFLLLVFYVGGFLRQIFCEASIDLNPLICMKAGISPEGIRFSLAAALLFVLIAGVVIWRGNGKEVAGRDEKRNFEYSTKGTYGVFGSSFPDGFLLLPDGYPTAHSRKAWRPQTRGLLWKCA